MRGSPLLRVLSQWPAAQRGRCHGPTASERRRELDTARTSPWALEDPLHMGRRATPAFRPIAVGRAVVAVRQAEI